MAEAPFLKLRTDIRKDERFDVVADICGYSRYEAVGRMVDLWAWCSDRRLKDAPAGCKGYAVSEAVVVRFLGPHGVDALLGGGVPEFALGERWESLIYLRGTEEQVGRLRQLSASARNGGVARESSATREGGKFVSKATIDQPTASRQPADEPAGTSVEARDQIPDLPEALSQCAGARGPAPVVASAPLPGAQPDADERRAACRHVWDLLVRERAAVVADLGLSVPAMRSFGTGAQDPGERDLAALYRNQTRNQEDRDSLTSRLTHRILVAAAEARAAARDGRERSVQWLSPSLFQDSAANTRRDGMTVAQASAPRAPPTQRGNHLSVVQTGIRKTRML